MDKGIGGEQNSEVVLIPLSGAAVQAAGHFDDLFVRLDAAVRGLAGDAVGRERLATPAQCPFQACDRGYGALLEGCEDPLVELVAFQETVGSVEVSHRCCRYFQSS